MRVESNASYAGLTWNTYEKYKKITRDVINKNAKFNENLNVLQKMAIEQVVNEGMNSKNGETQVTQIRKNRNKAKLENTNKRSIKNMMGLEEENITVADNDLNVNEDNNIPDDEDVINVDDYEEVKDKDEVDLSSEDDFFKALGDMDLD